MKDEISEPQKETLKRGENIYINEMNDKSRDWIFRLMVVTPLGNYTKKAPILLKTGGKTW